MPVYTHDHTRPCGPPPPREDAEFRFDENTQMTNGQTAEDGWVDAGWDGPAKPGVWSDWVSRKVDKGDRWCVQIRTAKMQAESIGGIQFMGQRVKVKFHPIFHLESCPSWGEYWKDQ